MTQVIQIKRKFTGAGVPATLAPGELAYNSTGDKLYVGGDLATVRGLVGSERQLEVHAASPAQTVAGGAKTFPLAGLKIPGGNVGEFLSISNADGTLAYAPMVSATQQFVGSLDAAAGSLTFTVASGHPGPGLPAAAAANNGHYVICDTAGSTVPANVPPGAYNIGDWVISNGTAWTHLSFGGIETDMASEIGVVAPVTGGNNVQEVLESLEAADAAGAAADAAQDLLIAANAAAIAVNAADITAIEGVNTAQDTAINNKITKPATVAAALNIAVYSDTTGGIAADGGESIASLNAKIDLKQDIATATAGDVVGPAGAIANNLAAFDTATGKLIKDSLLPMASVGDVKGQTAPIAVAGNIAVYNGVDPKAIIDGTINVAQIALKSEITAEQSLDVKIAGSTMTGALILHAAPVLADPPLQAATKGYVDTAIAAIPGATLPITAAPITGDGTAGAPISFSGIVAEPVVFGGNGLTATPLTLLVVDGGEYV